MNAGLLLKNYKKRAKKNWSQSKDQTDMFEVDENANTKKTMRPQLTLTMVMTICEKPYISLFFF